MPFHFLIIKETPLSLFLSILGAICGGMALMTGSVAFHTMSDQMDLEGSVGWWLACLGFGAAAVLFYFIAVKSSKRQGSTGWKRSGSMRRRNLSFPVRIKRINKCLLWREADFR